MTAVTALHPPRRRDPVAHTVVRIGRVNLAYLGWFWVVVLPFVVVFSLVLARVNGSLDAAVVLYTRQGAVWFPFAYAIGLVTSYLRVHVAAGMTRRTFARATLLVGVGTGTGYALALALLTVVERALHHAAGWGWRVADAGLADETSAAGLLTAELVLTFVVANVSGLLVGAVYQRGGGWWGTLTLPLTVGPVAAVVALLTARGTSVPAHLTWAQAAPTLLAAALVVAVTAAAYVAVVTRTPIRQPAP